MKTRTPIALVLTSALGFVACSGNSEPAPAAARVESAPAAAPAVPQVTAPAGDALAFDAATSSVVFVASKVTASHEGRFSDVSGHLRFDAAEPSRSSFDLRVGIASLSIEPARLQGHLLTPDLLDAARFPEATFRSVSIAPASGGGYTVSGDMTIHGQTKRISFPATITVAQDAITATAEMTLDRRDFGVVYPGMPDDLIRDAVVLRVNLRAPRTAH